MEKTKEKDLDEVYQGFINTCLGFQNMEGLANFVDENIFGFGTAADEKIEGIDGLKKLIQNQINQSTGIQITWKIEPFSRFISQDENTAVLAEDILLTIHSDDEQVVMHLRLSTVLNHVDTQWKVIHWHVSKPEGVESEKDTWGIENWRQKAEEMERLVAEKTADLVEKNLELEIEAALERVRSTSLAMHSSQDLSKVVYVVFTELVKLDAQLDRCLILIVNSDTSGITWYLTGKEGLLSNNGFLVEDNPHPSHQAYLEGWRAKRKKWRYILAGEEKKSCDEYLFSQTELAQLPEFIKADMAAVESIHLTISSDDFGCLIASSLSPLSDAHAAIVERFSIVFNQAYTRFLDLQKAEAQAREAQIEAALERVRSRSMAMHKSEELREVIQLLFEQFRLLNFTIDSAQFDPNYKENDDLNLWAAAPGQPYSILLNIPYDDSPLFNSIKEAKKGGLSFITQRLSFEDKNQFFRHFFQHIKDIPVERQKFIFDGPGMYRAVVFMENVSLAIQNYSNTPYTEEEHDVLKRFGKTFEQVYTRFLDLQKAEAQAREAQIEAALERVRSRAMAMHSSNELNEVVHELRNQMGILGQKNLETCVIHLHNESQEYIQSWAGIKPPDEKGDILESIANVPKRGLTIIEEALNAYNSNLQDYVLLNEGEKLRQWFSFLEKEAPEGFSKLVDSVHGNIEELRSYWSFADFSGGSLLMVTRDEPDEPTRGLLRRFSNVFGLAYRRFADLKKAEAQAREAQIEAALEKVRSRTMAMQSSDELADAAYVLFEQLKSLGVTHERINIGIVDEENQTIDFWITEQGGDKLNTKFSGRISEPTTLAKAYSAWKQGEKSLVVDLQGDELKSWLNYLNYEIKIPFNQAFLHDRRVQTAGFFTKGMLIVTSPEPLQEEALYLLEKFAGVFDLTYTRFKDLKVAEAHALQAERDLIEIKLARQKAEDALTELKATQAQLIQQEKLASLGQLTAGIAHEIKNPLNFVNNFSEVSLELVGEIKAERTKKQESRDESLVDEILEDIQSNLEKIHEHGSRANGIVTSMLQHSRASSGKKEPTDLNALIKEYVNLSFHGMRAGKNPINVEIVLELDPAVKEVALIKEDFTRVIINLCNNAFDAMRSKTDSELYHPKLTVGTKSEKDLISIAVKDNGPGIPDDIKDKILQPFFTTKKGTEGTGLGLSITHDIVKAHGGELRVESKAGAGTCFSILLPVHL